MSTRQVLEDAGKLVLRLALGVLILFHGAHKLAYGIDSIKAVATGVGLPGFIAYGVYLGEIVGPVLLLIGWYARVGAALVAINMLFAFGLVQIHRVLELNRVGGWALELEGMYFFAAVALVLIGPGRISINRR